MKNLIQVRHNVIGKIESDKLIELIFLTHEIGYKANKTNKQIEIVKKDKIEQNRAVVGYDGLIMAMTELILLLEREYPETYKEDAENKKKKLEESKIKCNESKNEFERIKSSIQTKFEATNNE